MYPLLVKIEDFNKQGCARTNARGIPSMRWFLQGKGHKKVRILLLSLLLKKYEEDFNKPFFVLRIQTEAC